MNSHLTLIIFIVGYLAIMLEHPLGINKAAIALITAVLCWIPVFLQQSSIEQANGLLLHHLGNISSILFFLLVAMTIVELIDTSSGFEIITDRIRTKKKDTLLIIISIVTFFLSAFLDNLTTAIVMTSLCARLLEKKADRLWFAGIIIISANAGGAWSPLGDVTTTMLWIGGQVSVPNITIYLLIPSMAVCIIPTYIISKKFKGQNLSSGPKSRCSPEQRNKGRIILISGISLLIFVPIFKVITHLPPFMGMLLALGIIWIISTFMNTKKFPESAENVSVTKALQKIDAPSILFLLGILLAVAALESVGILETLANTLNKYFKNSYLIASFLGIVSSVIDNVPLVSASQNMYSLNDYPTDHSFWHLLALATGTGGSAIIVGSAAGVAAMGIEKIRFSWYLRKISLLALIGFLSGIAVFLLEKYCISVF